MGVPDAVLNLRRDFMESIIEQGNSQYKVSEGDVIRVPYIDEEVGKKVTIDRVLMTIDGEDVKVGTPVVDGVEIEGEITGHGKDKKIYIMKRKKRKDYRRRNGHRQNYSELKITSIKG